jgi:hypothetical protein
VLTFDILGSNHTRKGNTVNDFVPGPDIRADEERFVFVSSDASRHQVVSAHTEKVGKNLKIKEGAK